MKKYLYFNNFEEILEKIEDIEIEPLVFPYYERYGQENVSPWDVIRDITTEMLYKETNPHLVEVTANNEQKDSEKEKAIETDKEVVSIEKRTRKGIEAQKILSEIVTETRVNPKENKENKYKVSYKTEEEHEWFLSSVFRVFESDELKLDLYSELYFQLLYKEKNDSFIDMMLPGWGEKQIKTKDQMKKLKLLFRERLKERKRKRKSDEKKERDYGYEIIYTNSINVNNEKQIKNVAPNIFRLWVISKEFRVMLRTVNDKHRKEHKFLPFKIDEEISVWDIQMQFDDLWMLEQLFGFNTAFLLYILVSEIFQDKSQEIVKQHHDDINRLVEAVMKWRGIYSRSVLICELIREYHRIKENDVDEKLAINSLIDKVTHFIENYEMNYGRLLMNIVKEEFENNDKDEKRTIERIEPYVEKLRARLFEDEYLLKTIKGDMSSIKNESIYKLIQTDVIGYCLQGAE